MNKTILCLLSCLSLTAIAPTAMAMSNVPPLPETCAPVVYPAVSEASNPLFVDGRHIRDRQGRSVLLRGVNMSGDSKVPPFMPVTDAAMLDPLPDWGINTLRLLFTWEAYEPRRCQYDAAYLQYYEQIVQWAAARNIYVIVDFHQDAYSRFSIDGCGEGFPEWALYSGIARKQPDNGHACEGWGTKMIFDLSHHNTWHHFHANTEGARSRYIEMTRSVAERMAKYPNVIGYELINEPWGNDQELAALFNDAGAAIRSRHPSSILFVPPHALMSSGMGSNNIAKPAFGNFVYAPHFYDAFVILFRNWLGTDPSGALDNMAAHAAGWNVPLLLGEFGAPATTSNVDGYMSAMYDWLNKGLHSGTQWNYTPTWRSDSKDGWNQEDLSISDDNRALRANFRPRAYPVAISGSQAQFREDPQGFDLTWQHIATQGGTLIYVPAGLSQITTSPGMQCTQQGHLLHCDGVAGTASVSVR